MTPAHVGAQGGPEGCVALPDFTEMRGLATELGTRVCPLIHEQSLSQMTSTRSSCLCAESDPLPQEGAAGHPALCRSSGPGGARCRVCPEAASGPVTHMLPRLSFGTAGCMHSALRVHSQGCAGLPVRRGALQRVAGGEGDPMDCGVTAPPGLRGQNRPFQGAGPRPCQEEPTRKAGVRHQAWRSHRSARQTAGRSVRPARSVRDVSDRVARSKEHDSSAAEKKHRGLCLPECPGPVQRRG